ncbi:olfactomedin-like protein 1 [Pygocentrus nattereri]|uniref:Olfactomedin-like domain-containing protein n=1 Tax=Pygocentrus nattereri TaxID=42514 RepID=A0A3B4E9T8_PYGNA|nr:olfactomedin-like protein 1 [Pygocentrus nattereri]XP_037396339.1 olfactomedin-like protein 1 [Pygocentrus nattereri]
MSRMLWKLLPLLLLPLGTGQAQRTTQDVFMMQYFQRRLQELEERLNRCDQDLQSFNQKVYDMSSEMRGQIRSVNVLKSEIQGHVDNLALRVDRVERDVEYLQNKIPDSSDVEIAESVIEQEVKEAQLKKKVAVTQGKDCSTHLSGIKSQKIVKKAGDLTGSWMKDSTKGSSRIYFFSGSRNSTLLEFVSLKAFTDTNWTRKAEIISLPLAWQGTGHVVYNGFMYYHHANTRNEVLKVHLLNRTVTDRMLLPGAGRMPTYSLSSHTLLDLAVDELGLWAIHADPDFGGNLVVTKLDSNSLAVEHTWDTSCKSHNAEGAFIICGTMYVVYNSHSGGRSSVKCLFDIHDTLLTEEMPVIFFPKRYTSHSGMHYHPKEKQVYAWDDGYQTIYKLDTKRKLQVT